MTLSKIWMVHHSVVLYQQWRVNLSVLSGGAAVVCVCVYVLYRGVLSSAGHVWSSCSLRAIHSSILSLLTHCLSPSEPNSHQVSTLQCWVCRLTTQWSSLLLTVTSIQSCEWVDSQLQRRSGLCAAQSADSEMKQCWPSQSLDMDKWRSRVLTTRLSSTGT